MCLQSQTTDNGKAPALTAAQPAVSNGPSYRSKLLGRRGIYSLTGGPSATINSFPKSGKTLFGCSCRVEKMMVHFVTGCYERQLFVVFQSS